MKRNICFFLIFISIFFLASFCFAKDSIKLWVDPEAIFLDQSVELHFTLKLNEFLKNPKITLMKVHKATDEKLAPMRDDGKNGDKKAGDRHFSAVIKFTPKKIGTLIFRSLLEYPKSHKQISHKVKVDVIECPQ